MVLYGIVLLLMIKKLKAKYPDVKELWYDENYVAVVTFDNVLIYFNYIKCNGPMQGYYPNLNIKVFNCEAYCLVPQFECEAYCLVHNHIMVKWCYGA